MTGTKRIKLPFWATLLTVLGVMILCGLGTWQLQRLEWKESRLNALNTAYESPISLNQALIDNTMYSDFYYGYIIGTPLIEKSFFLGYQVKDGIPGHNLIVPLKTGFITWLVNMGWTEKDLESARASLKNLKNHELKITGIALKPSWNSFTPPNEPDKYIWYSLDTKKIKESYSITSLSKLVIYAEKSEPQISENLPNNTRWQPNNNHAQYAFFWFTLAGTLIIIYGLKFLKKQN